MSDALARVLVDTCARDATFMASVVAYAADHSTNAMRRRRPEDATTEVVVFDWLSRLARDLEAVPAGKIRMDGNALWVSRRVVMSLDALERRAGPARAGDVREVREWLRDDPKGRGKNPSPTLTSVLREMDFAGGLLERLIVDPDFDFGPTFGTRRCLVSRLLRHARTNGGPPLRLMELKHESAFSGGRSMRPPMNDTDRVLPPWKRTWNAAPRDVEDVAESFSEVLESDSHTHRGQRKFALRLLRGSRVRGDREWFGAAWILSAGGNVAARRRLLTRTPELRELREIGAWPSFVVPWIDPRFLLDSTDSMASSTVSSSTVSSSASASVVESTRDAVRSFFVVAAVLDAAPEGHECAFRAWEGTEEELRAVERDRPHLAHVVEKVLRHRRERALPPETLVTRVVDAMRRHVVDADDVDELSPRPTFVVAPRDSTSTSTMTTRLGDIVRTLERDGCRADAERVVAFDAENETREIGAFVFEDDEGDRRITRIDVEHAGRRRRDGDGDGGDDARHAAIAVFGTTTYYLLATRDSATGRWPTIARHPLSSLVMSTSTSSRSNHPLASSCAEFLSRGARLGV